MDYNKILESIHIAIKRIGIKGKVADYLPPLASVPPDKFGMAIKLMTGEEFKIGNADEPFAIRSIAKVISLTLCLQNDSNILNTRVGIEPAGNPVNTLVQLELEKGVPRNPFMISGAVVIVDALLTQNPKAKEELLEFTRSLSENENVAFDAQLSNADFSNGARNMAVAHFIKSFNNLENDVEKVLDLYYCMNSLRMSCTDLVRTFAYLSNGGKTLGNELILSKRQTKKVNAMLLTCGTLDAVGNFAYKVGLPAKSGSGGGIIGVMPGEYTIAVWSPGLDDAGNSLLGTKAMELFTTITGKSIF